jgi:phosphoglucosamine mutase
LIAGLTRHEIRVYYADILPTPAIARFIIDRQADFGIIVTASHNPSCDNGIKLFDYRGYKLDNDEETLIESILDREESATGGLPSTNFSPINACASYVKYLRSFLSPNSLSDWHIALDLANGATFETTPAVFNNTGASLHIIGNHPNGENINDGFGSECPEQLSSTVLKNKATIGIAHDGDGDRLVVCDERGVIVDGDIILGLLGKYAMQAGLLSSATLVATIHSNLGLDHALRSVGVKVERVEVGDRNVAKRMRELGSNIGGESSGHIIFSDFATTGDGLLSAIKIIEIMILTGKALSELRQEVILFPQLNHNLRVKEKIPLDRLELLKSTIHRIESHFKDQGRVLVRYSGTEPKLRVLVEGQDKSLIYKAMEEIKLAAVADLEVIDS